MSDQTLPHEFSHEKMEILIALAGESAEIAQIIGRIGKLSREEFLARVILQLYKEGKSKESITPLLLGEENIRSQISSALHRVAEEYISGGPSTCGELVHENTWQSFLDLGNLTPESFQESALSGLAEMHFEDQRSMVLRGGIGCYTEDDYRAYAKKFSLTSSQLEMATIRGEVKFKDWKDAHSKEAFERASVPNPALSSEENIPPSPPKEPASPEPAPSLLRGIPKDEMAWRLSLSREEYAILRDKGTEEPGSGKYLHEASPGVYRCGACGNPLYSSETKYDSGTGWPSFSDALPGAVELVFDIENGVGRTEALCARCHSHLGHVFDDGPTETGKRYCMNSLALFLEKEDDKKASGGDDPA